MGSAASPGRPTPADVARARRRPPTEAHPDPAPGSDRAAGPHEETLVLLAALDATAKQRAALVRAHKDRAGGDPAVAAGLTVFLRAVTEHRKRLRSVRRVWESLAPQEPPPERLGTMTTWCRQESALLEGLLGRALRESDRAVGGRAVDLGDPAGHGQASHGPLPPDLGATSPGGRATR